MKWAKKGQELEGKMKKFGTAVSSVWFWGAGKIGQRVLSHIDGKMNLTGFIDSNLEKEGEEVCGYPVFSPSHLDPERDVVLITVSNEEVVKEIRHRLQELGFRYGENYFLPAQIQLLIQPQLYQQCWEEKRAKLYGFGFYLTNYCTFRCKDCVNLVPYHVHKAHRSVSECMAEIRLLFTWFDEIDVFQFIGGDAMLHPDLLEIYQKTVKEFGHRIQRYEVWTNAILLPSEALLLQMKEHNGSFHVTDYKEQGEEKQKISEFVSIAQEYGIDCNVTSTQYWHSFGDATKNNGVPISEMEAFFHQCERRTCYDVRDGKLFHCCRALNAYDANRYEWKESDYFDLNRYQPQRKRELMEFLMGYCENGFPSYCKKCFGGAEENRTFVPAGTQLHNERSE